MRYNQNVATHESPGTLPQFQAGSLHHILVVDDDISLRHLSTELLSHSGYEVDAAEDGAAAWEALGADHYDLMITDNKMPNLTGIELLKKLYAIHMDLPVIMASGTMPDEDFIQCPWLQPAGKLLKPYSVAELLGTVERVLREADSTADGLLRFEPRVRQESRPSPMEVSAGSSRVYLTNPPSRILLVDDDRDTRQLSVDVLSGSGYEVEAVLDGAAGWESLQRNRYDLVITDNQMPKMTGMEMIEKLRSARMDVPVIMATGHLPLNEFARKPWLKPNATLQRPFSDDDLLETVKTVLHPDNHNGGGKAVPLPQHS